MTAPGPAPGFRKYPDHTIEIESSPSRWRASLGDEVLAESGSAMVLRERRYAPVVYFPADDVAFDRLAESETVTTCPFKGEARYFRAAAGDEDIAWSYPETYDEVAAIAGYVAFYADRVDVSETPGV
jgi:uncharacterized protein (DUF427 family)